MERRVFLILKGNASISITIKRKLPGTHMKKSFSRLKLIIIAALCLSPIQALAQEQAQEHAFVVLPGDVLQITVWKEDGMDREVAVLPDGSITFPLIGTINVQDMALNAIQDDIKKQLESTIPDASVTVSVKSPLGHKASILGQVQNPGEIILSARTDVMQALSQAGGLTPYADKGDIVVIRTNKDGTKKSLPFPYHDIARGKNFKNDIELQPGDVVLVPTGGLF